MVRPAPTPRNQPLQSTSPAPEPITVGLIERVPLPGFVEGLKTNLPGDIGPKASTASYGNSSSSSYRREGGAAQRPDTVIRIPSVASNTGFALTDSLLTLYGGGKATAGLIEGTANLRIRNLSGGAEAIVSIAQGQTQKFGWGEITFGGPLNAIYDAAVADSSRKLAPYAVGGFAAPALVGAAIVAAPATLTALGSVGLRAYVTAAVYAPRATAVTTLVATSLAEGVPAVRGGTGPVQRVAAESAAPLATRGGTYVLKDADGVIVRSGRTNNFVRRQAEHARDPALKKYNFEEVHRTDDYAQQRGLEQILHETHSPQLNRIRGVDPNNPKAPIYKNAAEDYLLKYGGP